MRSFNISTPSPPPLSSNLDQVTSFDNCRERLAAKTSVVQGPISQHSYNLSSFSKIQIPLWVLFQDRFQSSHLIFHHFWAISKLFLLFFFLCFLFYFLFIFLFFLNFILFLNLKHCISFAKHQNESATGIHMLPILNPPSSSLPTPSLWVVPVHQPQASSIVHQTWTGNSFHTWYYTFQCHSPKSSHPLPVQQSFNLFPYCFLSQK